MTYDDAQAVLAQGEVAPVLEGPLADIKRLVSRCLDRDIAAMLGRKCLSGGGS